MGLKAMNLVYKMIITLFLITLSTAVSAGSVWDGSVSIARYGYLPQTGMYAASNAFPKNTTITVTNPETGKSVDVTVIERLEDNNLFLVLSSEAAEEMGISYGTVFHGSITEQNPPGSVGETELPFNPDPDVNSSGALVENPELALIQDYINNELGGSDPALIIPDTADTPVVPENISDELMNNETDILKDAVTEPPVAEIIKLEAAEPEIQNTEISDTEPAAADLPEPEIPETEIINNEPVIAESPGSEIPEIPTVENMPLEEVYNKEPEGLLPAPDLTELLREKEVDAGSLKADIPKAEYLGAIDPPVIVSENFDTEAAVPSLPVKEVDIPIITTMPDAEGIGLAGGDIDISVLPELPLIGVDEIAAEEIPVAVRMDDDVVLMEESVGITTILPELVVIGNIPDTPVIEELFDEKPVVNEFTVQEPEKEDDLPAVSVIPEIKVPKEEPEPPPPVPELIIPEEGVEIVLEPSDLRPPEVEEKDVTVKDADVITAEEPAAEPIAEQEPVKGDKFNITRELVKDSYYLQLGAYREEYSAMDLAGQLEDIYPVTVYVSENRDIVSYKVMVGPLGLDESGVILYNFKSMGYEDAFLRKGL